MSHHVLIVEDDANIRDVCTRYLKREGYHVTTAEDGVAGWEAFQQMSPNIVIVDVMMPKKDGFALCQDIRTQSEIPIIILTARTEERDRVMGLTLGADDYITKPFSPRELVLRVQNIFRRMRSVGIPSTAESKTELLALGNLTIDTVSRKVFIDDGPITLTVKEFDVLYLLARRHGQVFSKGQILDLVWGLDSDVDTSAVTVLIRRLREKVEMDPSQPKLIQTVWGIGYRFETNEASIHGASRQ